MVLLWRRSCSLDIDFVSETINRKTSLSLHIFKYVDIYYFIKVYQRFEFLPLTLIFQFLLLCNPFSKTFKGLHHKVTKIWKCEFVAKTQFLLRTIKMATFKFKARVVNRNCITTQKPRTFKIKFIFQEKCKVSCIPFYSLELRTKCRGPTFLFHG